MIPPVLDGLPIHWQGTDDSTPDGCTQIVTTVLGLTTTYLIRDGQILGRIEIDGNRMNGYVGSGLKGGRWVGSGDSAGLANKIADQG